MFAGYIQLIFTSIQRNAINQYIQRVKSYSATQIYSTI
jgi:hypothetical protein